MTTRQWTGQGFDGPAQQAADTLNNILTDDIRHAAWAEVQDRCHMHDIREQIRSVFNDLIAGWTPEQDTP